jgi:NAD-dependent SIR2 family protein deacetylase
MRKTPTRRGYGGEVDSLTALIDLLRGRRTFVLVGAGCSTESGIPDYRGPQTRHRARNPVQFKAFVGDPASRRRYWARAYVGWPAMARARPNPAHRALADLEAMGTTPGLVTQNVDGLHLAAGSQRVIELHGALRDVVCLGCGARFGRDEVQAWMAEANPGFGVSAEIAPDGDAELAGTDRFAPPSCPRCAGDLKPDVVFFGENVPRVRVEAAYAWLAEAERVLVVGSSLAVFSGYRFVKRAHERGVPIGIVNLGESRGDPLASVRVDAPAGEVLPALVRALG